jgi:hypothetical protein
MQFSTSNRKSVGISTTLELELSEADCVILSMELQKALNKIENPEECKALRSVGELLNQHLSDLSGQFEIKKKKFEVEQL